MTKPNADVKKFIPRQYLNVLGKNLPAILDSFNGNIKVTEDLINACIDQLFLTTASGNYLVQLGESSGFTMPQNSGLDIRSYRVLVPIMAAAPKQVRMSIDELIQAFYKNERTKASVTSSAYGPFSLANGDDLIIETEQGTVEVSITSSQVSDITDVSAQEISAVFNSIQDVFVAEAITDRSTGFSRVRISSKTLGSSSFVRIAGGTLQNLLKFPEVINIESVSGTTWNITKDSIYTDQVRVQWGGSGSNPNVYRADKGDIVTIRGLVDGAYEFSKLNGSYSITDIGYDYFLIQNERFSSVSATLSLPDDSNFTFTKNKKISLLDANEYALTSETTGQTITITVPAIPPLARRFLQGSAHIHGNVHDIVDFTRTSIQVGMNLGQDIPIGDNHFIITNNYNRPDFFKKYYKTESVNTAPADPIYNMIVSDEDFSVMPYTIPTSVASVYAEVGSDEIVIDFGYKHGLLYKWGFTLDGLSDTENFTSVLLNKEHETKRVIDSHKISFSLRDSNGDNIKFNGIQFGSFDVVRHALPQADGSDFYLEFGTALDASNSGLEVGMNFVLDPLIGVSVDPYLANTLRYKTYSVSSLDGSKINFSSGLGNGPQGTVISAGYGNRSGEIGLGATYFLDKTSILNQKNVFSNLNAVFIGYTPPSNPLFLGPYIYDPDGVETNLTVSKYLVNTNDNIQIGESRSTIFVDDSNLNGDFPQTGEIVVDYGTSKVEGPIRYNAFVKNQSSSQILIDPSYKFKKSHPEGAQVQFILENRPYTPTTDGEDYPLYITGTAAARDALFSMIDLLTATGIFVEANVNTPDLRYSDIAIDVFE